MKVEEVAVLLGKVALAYPNQGLSQENILAWYELFKHEDADVFGVALNTTVRTGKFFPTPGEVGHTIEKQKKMRLKTVTAEELWATAIRLARAGVSERVVYKRIQAAPKLDEAEKRALTLTIDFLTWETIRTTPASRRNIISREFCRVFNEHVEKFKVEMYQMALPLNPAPQAELGYEEKI